MRPVDQFIPYLFLAAGYVLLPVFVAHVLFRGTWQQILQAYGLLISVLFVIGFAHGGPHGEGYAWAILIALFATVFSIPVFVLIFKLRSYLNSKRGR